jgi:hypothetical protein
MSRCHVRKCRRKDVNHATKVFAARSVADTTSRIAPAAVNNDTNVDHEACRKPAKRAHPTLFSDLLTEDNRLNVYAGELEVCPPGAPTINSR